jgi:hypothetical protein
MDIDKGDLEGFQKSDLYPNEIEVYLHELKAMAQYSGMCYFIFAVMREQGFCTVRPRACADILRVNPAFERLVEFAEEAEADGYEFITLYPFS